ncbi:MAG: class C sortase [Leucobacter sp.]
MEETRRRWGPSALSWTIVLFGLLGLGALIYPSASQWVSAYNQSKLIHTYSEHTRSTSPAIDAQFEAAYRYNDALTSGVHLAVNEAVPAGTGTSSDPSLAYETQLSGGDTDVMARLRYPAVGVDLPVYHGTDDETLLRGAGHLEGSSLPVGGEDTHSVITAHRGLAEATMFTHLDQASVGDTFVLEVLGEVFTYRVRDTHIVAPDQREDLRVVPGEDLVTLVTCTPLGINSHRILVTAERVFPTPVADIQSVGEPSDVPGPPLWIFALVAGMLVLGLLLWRTGRSDGRSRGAVRHAAES